MRGRQSIRQRYDGTGAPVGAEFAVNGYTPRAQVDSTAVATGTGSFVLLWSSERQDGDDVGIFGSLKRLTSFARGGRNPSETTCR